MLLQATKGTIAYSLTKNIDTINSSFANSSNINELKSIIFDLIDTDIEIKDVKAVEKFKKILKSNINKTSMLSTITTYITGMRV